MDELFRELGDLFLGSVPTVILFLLLVFCYTTLVHMPLQRTLATRRERTAGTVEKAHAATAIAEAKAQEYEARLRAARLEINQAREKQIAGWNTARDRAIAEARERAAAQVREARATIEADARQSRASMDASIDALAGQILAEVLPSTVSPGGQGEQASAAGERQEVRS